MDKNKLRKQIITERDQLTDEEIATKSATIAEKLYSLSAFNQAEAIMYFVSFGSEVDTRPIVEETIRRRKIALAPKAVPQSRELIPSRILDWDSDLMPGYYNIPEPRAGAMRPYDPEQIDLLIVPGVAFDLKGNRLGYGGGYYDRFFSLLKPGTPLVALVFDLQIVPTVPTDEWDRPVDCVITEKRIIEIKPL
ncbi:MAG: 5-formyltetrahydrofolate cyclo-ligase [Firmicutes bacterium]|nr:5-formyltetrahydrofolate cyclo-ligase [Bacillota bacterium]